MATNKIRVTLNNVRISFPNLFVPKSFNDDPALKKNYTASFLISKDDKENNEAIRAAITAVVKMQWPNNAPKIKPEKMAYRDGDNESWDGYEGNFYVNASNSEAFPPKVIDLDGSNLRVASLDNTPGDKPQGGDYVNAVIDFWVQDNAWGTRVNAALMGVQYVSKGERFGGGGSDDDMFATTIVKKAAPEKTERELEEEEARGLFGE